MPVPNRCIDWCGNEPSYLCALGEGLGFGRRPEMEGGLMSPTQVEDRIKRLRDRLEFPDLSEREQARIEKQLKALLELQES